MSKTEDQQDHDIVLLHSLTEDGQGVRALRSRSGQLDLTEIRPVVEGQNVADVEVVQLRPRKEIPFGFDVDVIYAPQKEAGPESKARRSGPLRVSTRAYRKNWDRVFGLDNARPPKDPLLN